MFMGQCNFYMPGIARGMSRTRFFSPGSGLLKFFIVIKYILVFLGVLWGSIGFLKDYLGDLEGCLGFFQ